MNSKKDFKGRNGARFGLLIAVLSLAAILVLPGNCAVAGEEEFNKQLVEHWKRMVNPDNPQDIAAALDLADRTVVLVEKSRKIPDLAAKLAVLRQRWESKQVPDGRRAEFYFEVRALRRQIIMSHPALDFEKILINRNPPTTFCHNGDQHLGIHSRPGPGLTMLTNWKYNPHAEAILKDKLPVGAVRNPDMNYDADKVVFAFCDHSGTDRKRFWLYEAALDGSSVRQLTGTERDTFKTWHNRATVVIEDNDPCYMPDGNIVFISTRSQSFGRCHGGRYNPAWVLYKCDATGDNIRQMSFANENEYEPSLLNDGRIIFTRWEYTNRHEMFFHKLWTCRPDGTSVAHYYGNDTIDPMEVLEASAIPGTDKIVATAQGHHSYNTGTAITLDVKKGENGEEPVTHLTPETPYSESHGWPDKHFSHPYAITEDLFLVSRANHRAKQLPENDRAIYLIDTLGGRELIYEDPAVASFSPIPVRKRKRPPVIPSMLPAKAPDYGTLYVQNVYLTRNDPEKKIKPGMIKAIRVNALGVQPRADRAPCSMTVRVELPKKILGTAPVAADGSASFRVPAETSLQLQILDGNGMAILTERSLFYLQKGEVRSCVGCHEQAGTSPQKVSRFSLFRKPVSDLTPPAGPHYEGGLSFMRTVQPVLDRYCITCHGLEKTGKGVNLVHDGNLIWPRSAEALIRRGQHRLGDKGFTGSLAKNISRPFEYYANGNSVPAMLLKGHQKLDLDKDSFHRIVDWLDLNAQCYGDLFPNKVEQRRFNYEALGKLREYVKQVFGDELAGQPERALVNLAQPDESRILCAPLAVKAGGWGQIQGWKNKNEPGYRKMAELVEACIVRAANENSTGWYPSPERGGGEDWVIKDQEDYIKRLKGAGKAGANASP